jgi:thiamine biosynthesis lipoprotein
MRCLVLLAAACLLAACGQPEPWRTESYVFGTRVELAIAGAPEVQARAAADKVLRDFDVLHRGYHAWQPSELSTLNAAIADGRAMEVSAELAAYLRDAQAVAAAGDHLFDPGIGRLVALWGFHADDIRPALPDGPALKALIDDKPSIADLKLDGRQVSSRKRNVAIDFGGYLKGVALDRAVAILREAGIGNALVNIGGNVMALGSRDGKGTPWRIGIQHPRPQSVGGAPLASLELKDGEAIGTSGDYHRYFEIGGRRYCHLIDPRSGFPAEGTQAVTVLIGPGARTGMRSDALSKPIFIAGREWRAMAQKLGVDAVLRVGADGTANATPAMHARLKVEAPDLRIVAVP